MRLGTTLCVAIGITIAGAANADPFEPNNSTAEAAGPLQHGVACTATISPASDEDWYFVDVDPGLLVISLTDIPQDTDYDLFLTDHDANIYAASRDSGHADELISEVVVVPGRFWIRVEGPPDHATDEPYTLVASFTPPNTRRCA